MVLPFVHNKQNGGGGEMEIGSVPRFSSCPCPNHPYNSQRLQRTECQLDLFPFLYIVPFGQLNIAKNGMSARLLPFLHIIPFNNLTLQRTLGERPCPIVHNRHNRLKRKNKSSVRPVGLLTHTKKGIGLAVCLYRSIRQLTIAKDARERSHPIVGPLWTHIVPYACSEGAATLGQT